VRKNTNPLNGIWKLPLTGYPLFDCRKLRPIRTYPLAGSLLPRLASSPGYDDYWKRWSIEEHYPDINVPALTIAAWYDIFLGGSLRNYTGIKLQGGSEAARHGQSLLVTIGGHAGSGRKIGDIDFGRPLHSTRMM